MKIIPGAASLTKELYVPVTANGVGGGQTAYGQFPIQVLTAIGHRAFFSFKVPHDFNSIVSAEIIIIPLDTDATANIDTHSNYGSIGQPYATHSEDELAATYNMTADQLLGIDVSGILTALLAGDIVGLGIDCEDGTHRFYVVGFCLLYS